MHVCPITIENIAQIVSLTLQNLPPHLSSTAPVPPPTDLEALTNLMQGQQSNLQHVQTSILNQQTYFLTTLSQAVVFVGAALAIGGYFWVNGIKEKLFSDAIKTAEDESRKESKKLAEETTINFLKEHLTDDRIRRIMSSDRSPPTEQNTTTPTAQTAPSATLPTATATTVHTVEASEQHPPQAPHAPPPIPVASPKKRAKMPPKHKK